MWCWTSTSLGWLPNLLDQCCLPGLRGDRSAGFVASRPPMITPPAAVYLIFIAWTIARWTYMGANMSSLTITRACSSKLAASTEQAVSKSAYGLRPSFWVTRRSELCLAARSMLSALLGGTPDCTAPEIFALSLHLGVDMPNLVQMTALTPDHSPRLVRGDIILGIVHKRHLPKGLLHAPLRSLELFEIKGAEFKV